MEEGCRIEKMRQLFSYHGQMTQNYLVIIKYS